MVILLQMWLAKQETLTLPGCLVSILIFERTPGVLECPSQFTTVTPRRWCFSFLCGTATMFIHIFQRIALNWIHSFANWRNVVTCDYHLTNQICNTQKQIYITFALELVLRGLRFMFFPFNLCVKTTLWRPPALSNFLWLWTVLTPPILYWNFT